jgi:hypothetical protein
MGTAGDSSIETGACDSGDNMAMSEEQSIEPAAPEAPPQPQTPVEPARVEPPPQDPRRRLRELLAIPDHQRTDAIWDEIIELEISLAPGNRIQPGTNPGDPGRRPQGAPARIRGAARINPVVRTVRRATSRPSAFSRSPSVRPAPSRKPECRPFPTKFVGNFLRY